MSNPDSLLLKPLKYLFTRLRVGSIITFSFIFQNRLIHLERGNHYSWLLKPRGVNPTIVGGATLCPNPTANSVSVVREELELVRMILCPLGYYLCLVGFLLFH